MIHITFDLYLVTSVVQWTQISARRGHGFIFIVETSADDKPFFVFCQGLEGDKTMQLAIADPDRYVLKPQLEGGGEMNMVFLFFLGLFFVQTQGTVDDNNLQCG